MRWMQILTQWVRAATRHSRVERELDSEMADHLASEVEELTARGMPAAEARRHALATMGRLDAIREECRDSRGVTAWEHLRQDVAFGVRLLLKNRTYAAMALVTMALGIGSTTAVFSVIDGILIRPLPFDDPDRLYHASDVGMRGPFDVLRANSRLADYAGHLGVRSFNVTGRERPERIKGSEVSANFFRVLGVGPLLGRTFVDGEEQPGMTRIVILSHDFWTQRYGARSDAIGRQLILDESPYEIVGVMPAGFRFPAAATNFWIPMRLDPRIVGEYWGAGGIWVFTRLRPGGDSHAAEAELRTSIDLIRPMFPWRMPDAWGTGARLSLLHDQLVRHAKLRGKLLLGVVTFVLLIAIVNVANLMIGQTMARQRELALRASLGATPGRLMRQLLTEAVLLAGAGGVLGAGLAFAQLDLLRRLLPADTPRLSEIAIDARVLAFTALISLASGLVFGLLPAWRARRQRSLAASEGRSWTLSAGGARTGAALVMTEAAFATILLVGAGLMLRTLWTMLHIDPGVQVESIVTAELSPHRAVAGSLDKTVALYEQVRAAISSHPGVTKVTAANVLPVTREFATVSVAIEDHPRPPQDPQFSLWMTLVTPEHFDTLGIRLLRGRGFTEADRKGAQRVILIGRAMAEKLWPGVNPVGRRIRAVWLTEWWTIVGVVENVRNFSITGPPEWVDGEIYMPLAQAMFPPSTLSLIARVEGDSASFERRLPDLVRDVCANCVVSKIARMEQVVAASVEDPRSMAWLVGGFAALALVLAAAGIYGVVSHGVTRRTRELGVRLALGASRGRVAWLVMASSLRFTLAGTLVGLAGSLALARWIKTLLYGVTPQDPLSFTIAPVALIAVAVVACVVPMWRAMRIDPAQSLREG